MQPALGEYSGEVWGPRTTTVGSTRTEPPTLGEGRSPGNLRLRAREDPHSFLEGGHQGPLYHLQGPAISTVKAEPLLWGHPLEEGTGRALMLGSEHWLRPCFHSILV